MPAPDQTRPQQFIVLRYNHFDPIWRRCWDRDFHDAGRRFVPVPICDAFAVEMKPWKIVTIRLTKN